MTEAARLYGGSMYELAKEEQMTDRILSQMEEIRQIFKENPEYVRLLSELAIPKKDRAGLIEEAFGKEAERYLTNFLKVLCDHNLIGEFAGCCEEYIRRYQNDNGIASAVVYSAVPLSDAQRSALTEKLAAMSGKKIALTEKCDPRIVAGLKVELEGKLLDGTVKGRLASLSKKLADAVV